jgi:hypothetical protein
MHRDGTGQGEALCCATPILDSIQAAELMVGSEQDFVDRSSTIVP